ncbi:MAG: hypothetical protein FI707_09305 [SAR202 cluster bacterium]|nr:hypothetical protein [SAR202 cluster bacterium]
MGAKGDNLLFMILWAAVSFVLALCTLFALIGIFLLGFVLIPLVPVAAVVVAIVAAVRQDRPYVVLEEAVAIAEAREKDAERLVVSEPEPAIATVMTTEGLCPMGLAFQSRETWTMNGRWVGREICDQAERVFSEAAARLRTGETPAGELWQCAGSEHRVLLQLRQTGRMEPVAVAASRTSTVDATETRRVNIITPADTTLCMAPHRWTSESATTVGSAD